METFKFYENRKVAILQQINSTQSLVREVFLNEKGEDVIAKEPFVVSTINLTDSILTSYKVGMLKQYEEDYEKTIKEWEYKIEREEIRLKNEYDKVYHLTKAVQELASTLSNENRLEFIKLLDFMSGSIEWVVANEYNVPKIIHFNELNLYQSWEGRIEGMKLITLFGMPNGKLQYMLNEYRDGSGSWKYVFFYHEEHEAFDKFKEILLSKNISEDVIKAAKEYNITLDESKLKEFYSGKKEYLQNEIDKITQNLIVYKERLESITDN